MEATGKAPALVSRATHSPPSYFLALSPRHADNAQFNYRRPYTRLAEYQAGTLACFSYLDSLDDVFDTAMIDFCHLREAVGIAGFQK